MPWADLEAKFAVLVAPRLGAPASARIFAFVRDLERHDGLAELSRALTGPVAWPAGFGRYQLPR